ncbi:MAG: CBS domain-containing protein [Candidatus Jettenia sp.]|nr:MAG: CBS domain-containing protein [Candidatus Jettenia sp. AMX1]MBC6928499.1 CBS domain-containing protein [Candidatus Jettenia sp.]MCE7879825.1 CBS domain-containing protein [Candidatus Jettenia sp. AMX1]MCQ3925895.1 histidine kinase [Candidatus Jettenia sp.]MDL1937635.1 CBS domain-containing protein [Candidatus Jettenia sp. AMX1]
MLRNNLKVNKNLIKGGYIMIKKTAKDIMNKIVTAAKKKTIGRDLAVKLLSGMYSGLPVVDDNGKVIGIVSEFDLLKVIKNGKALEQVTAEEIMSKNPICVSENTSVDEIIDLMTKHNIIRIPIIRNDVLVGVVSRCDILSSIVEPEFVTVFAD